MRSVVTILAGALIATGLAASAAWGQQSINLSIGSGHPAGPAVWITAIRDFYVPEVNKRLQANGNRYQIVWREAYGGTVAKLGGVLEAVEAGVLDMGLVAYPFEPAKLFLHNFSYYVPFGTPDPLMAQKAGARLHQEVPYLHEVFEKEYNQVFLATTTINNYNLVTTFPVHKVADLKGQKIAAAGPNLPWVTAVGAIPVQGNLNEAYTAFQSGLYNGWVMFVDATWGFKLYEVAPYYTFTNFGAIVVGALTINKDTWGTLPAEVQTVLRDVAQEYGYEQVRMGLAKQERGLKAMKEAGTTVYEFPFEERRKWAAMMPNIPQEKADEANGKGMPGSQVIRAYIEALKAEGHQFPREWEVR
jgi:TRAP-type C4-dicarboxylate transport system substrate-binding protein